MQYRPFRRLLPALPGLCLASLLIAGSRPATATDASAPRRASDREFRSVKKEFQQKIRSRRPPDRVDALRLLVDFPTIEAAELVYATLLDDPLAEVRSAAVEFLKGLAEHADVTTRMLQRLTAVTRKQGMDRRTMGLLLAWGGTENTALQSQLQTYLNAFLGTPQSEQKLLHALIDEQVRKKSDTESMRLLMLLTSINFFQKNFGFQRCVVQGLMEINHPEALGQLINLLPRFHGQVQYDVVAHLVESSGQNFGADADRWKLWWLEQQGRSTRATGPSASTLPPSRQPGQYHGIPIGAQRVVFVLDTSLSMRGAKIEAAKTELLRTIHELPPDVQFSVIMFDNSVHVWQRRLVPATEQMKHIAQTVVLDQSLGANTASYDALEAAFALDPEAIYFLSDGAPQGGRTDNPDEIVATFTSLNRVRRVSIHSIGVDTDLPGAGNFARFMKTLAEANWGMYRAVH